MWRAGRDLLYVIPIVAIVGVTIALPATLALSHSLTDWHPGYPSPWIGLDNYKALATSREFQEILKNEAILLLGLPIWVIVPLLIATMLYEKVPAASAFRTIFFFPAVVAPALIGILFTFIFRPEGPLNAGLRAIGLGGVARDWLGDATWVKPVLILVLTWATMGIGVVIFSAALGAIPPEFFDAAKVDGASWLQRFRYVVAPCLRRVVELWSVILVIGVFVAAFPWIFTLTLGGPGYASTTIDFDIYQEALVFGRFGLAAAEAVFLLVIVAFVLLCGRLLSRFVTT